MTTISDIGAPAPGPAPDTVPAAHAGRSPRLVDPDVGHDHDALHGAAQAARADDRPHRREHRHPGRLPRRAPHLPRRRPPSPTGRPAATPSSPRWCSASCTSSGSSWRPSSAARRVRSTSPRGCSATSSSRAAPAWPCTSPASPPGWPSSSPWWRSATRSSARCASSPPRRSSTTTGSTCRRGSRVPALDSWAASHADEVICNFNFHGGPGLNGPPPSVPCGGGQTSGPPPGTAIQTKARGTVTVPATSSHGADPGVRGRGGQPGLRRLQLQLHGPLDLADGRRRPVDRAGGDHRVHRRTRAGLADGAADGRRWSSSSCSS